MNDVVNNPKHYTNHPSGTECIQITEHMGFCLGNAIKYLWRADLKNDAVEDMKKAIQLNPDNEKLITGKYDNFKQNSAPGIY